MLISLILIDARKQAIVTYLTVLECAPSTLYRWSCQNTHEWGAGHDEKR
jgi:hypothetical protein